ncbi:MAG TPA: hypothetical protein VFJ18_05915, partial [Pararhizobium sp.]|nr:hypothetical protein [Pararhizobium sp.]
MKKTRISIVMALLVSAAMPATSARAMPVPPGDVPVPLARPFLPRTEVVPQFPPPRTSNETTASIGRIDNPAAIVGNLREGLNALTGNDVSRASAIRDGM